MNKEMKQHLEAVVEAIIFSDPDAATKSFHEYVSLKTQAILMGEAEECDDDECEDKKDKKDDDEDKSDDKKDKKDDSDDKKKPFEKKDKKDDDSDDKDED